MSGKEVPDIGDNVSGDTKEESDEKRRDYLYPKTAKEALDRFEKGDIIHVIELGGMGPGYEQAIWIGIFRMIKAYHKEDINEWVDGKEFRKLESGITVGDEKLLAVSKDLDLSGAQAGAILSTYYSVMKQGWRHMMEKVPEDRKMMVNKDFPKYEQEGEE